MTMLERVHGACVHGRRLRVLANHIVPLLPESGTLLDVGCGDGALTRILAERRPCLAVRGLDVILRPDAHIPVERFDGRRIPCSDAGVDVVTLVDVLHHADDPAALMCEARRVARKSIVIKDHLLQGLLAGQTLRFMDRIGNARHGVAIPGNYWTLRKWREAFDELDLRAVVWETKLSLYLPPANWIFDRSLHFITRLEPRTTESAHG